MSSFVVAWMRRHPNAPTGLPAWVQNSLVAQVDYLNSYRTFYDDNHLNQKGKFFPDGDASNAGPFWELDCVGFTERIYEAIGYNLTASKYECGPLCLGWPLTMREQRDAGRAIPATVMALSGDFNGDGRADMALTGGTGWATIPVAFSGGDGSFSVTNHGVPSFPAWANSVGVQAVVGDFNGDWLADIALVGGRGWATIPIAFSNGDGTFSVVNEPVNDIPALATTEGVQAVAADFNGDGLDDIAIPGGVGFNTVPIAFAIGEIPYFAGFDPSLVPIQHAQHWGATPGVKIVGGDLNGDGLDDLAYAGADQSSVPVALSQGDGSFLPLAHALGGFAGWARSAGVKVVAGDFDCNGRKDLALTGGPGWSTLPVAFSNGDGSFEVSNNGLGSFPGWAQSGGAKAVAGDFNGDCTSDVGLTGPLGWGSIPVAYSAGNGNFWITNNGVPGFPGWAAAVR
jgi:hypothetical protein